MAGPVDLRVGLVHHRLRHRGRFRRRLQRGPRTISPASRVIDVTHQVPAARRRPGRGRARPGGALAAARRAPRGGRPRRRHRPARHRRPSPPRGVLVGPDNGLLLPAADALGGVAAAYALTEPAYQLPEVSRTFHGRDVFAPVAGHLCRGVDAGPARPAGCRGASCAGCRPPRSRWRRQAARRGADGRRLRQRPARRDAPTTSPRPACRPTSPSSTGHTARAARVGRTFADARPGALVVLADSAGHVAVPSTAAARRPSSRSPTATW